MQSTNDIKLGRFLSLVLRHNPGAAGIVLDEHGWADVAELLNGVRGTGRQIDRETLERIVRENNKRRYSFNADHTKIRANQGHSLQVDVELKEAKPPRYLYHGTAARFLSTIQAEGIRKMARQYVHLSGDHQTAVSVGRRHGTPVVLRINAGTMAENDIRFYRSENGVWLCEYVPPEYFCVVEAGQGGET
ncbi:MAG: RNA 2'-phosphotransferase [Lawsonibacter sp.]|jgi:putative RNA 2'-phosphotransferase|nr:RNA 2'-phosphotransferase [Lawsonibacter sp.]MDE6932341.1 RNA 2'-phosphotransferase [Oscillospiraceae bacterium]